MNKNEKKPTIEEFKYINIETEIIEIPHTELTKLGDARYKSKCPVCNNGILHVNRHIETAF